MKVIGIDPGLRHMGWGIVSLHQGQMQYIGCGVCASGSGPMARRLVRLHREIAEVVTQYLPKAAAVESAFVARDPGAALKLGQARAIAILATAQQGLQVAEYSPNSVKKTVVGSGHATKEQVAYMIKMMLPKAELESFDAADALAIAIHHAYQLDTPQLGTASQ